MKTCLSLLSLCGLLLLTVTGCEDPSSVGLDLVGDQGGDPQALALELDLERDSVAERTGAAPRVLAGTVDDPLLGTIAATGYLDLADATSRPENFEDSTLTGATLRLVPDYVYGDTTAAVTLALHDLTEDWSATGATADTSLQPIVGALIDTYRFSAGDSLLSLELPAAWLEANKDVLRDSTFADDFHGFQLAPHARGAVMGFDALASELRVATEQDTVVFPIGAGRTLTTIRHSGPVNLPPDRRLVQDGLGQIVSFEAGFPDSLAEASLNRFELCFPTDRETLEGTPDFVRPPLQTLRLYRIAEGDTTAVVDLTRSDEDGGFRVGNAASLEALRLFYQQALLGEEEVGRWQLRAPGLSGSLPLNTLNTALLYTAEAPEDLSPRIVLTVTSSE